MSTSSIDINLDIIGKFGRFYQSTNKRINIIYGGAGSGKSYSIAQWFLLKAAMEIDKRFLILRKTLPSLRITAYKLFLELLRQNEIPYELNKSELIVKIETNEILFKSLDDPEKIKSAEFNYIWIEEATEITLDDYRQLNLRLRRKTDSINQMFLTFNPIDSQHWIKREIIDKSSNDIAILKSNYLDNRFLQPEYVAQLEDLKNQDSTYYQVYALGEWGVLKNLIYSNWDVIDYWPENGDSFYGLDFGFNNPSVLIELKLLDEEIYLREHIYETHLTNNDLIERMKQCVFNRNAPIYADCAEPQRIKEIYDTGRFNIKESDKSVKDGIDMIKRHKIHIHKDSVNTIKEIQGYKWKEDKNGNMLDEPVKFADHACDAMRYGIFTHLKTQPIPTIWRLK